MRAAAARVKTIGEGRFIGAALDIILPLQLLFVRKIKVTRDVKFKVNLDVLLRPERATLLEIRQEIRISHFSDELLHPSEEYLKSMHPQGPNAPLANLPEEVGAIDSDGTYTLKGEWIEALDDVNTSKSGQAKPRSKTVILYFHGGAYALCSPKTHTHMLAQLAKDVGPGTRVFSVDYRRAPEHPFPAAIHDAFAAYLYLTEPNHTAIVLDEASAAEELSVDPKDIVVAGDSAGGNLAAAFMLYMARYVQPSTEPRFSLPHATLLLSPWVDITSSLSASKSFDWFSYGPEPLGTSPFDKKTYIEFKKQTASHDRLVDEDRLYAHRLGLENPKQMTRIEVYKDMVHVHQALSFLFQSGHIATKNLARFIERSEHLRDEQERELSAKTIIVDQVQSGDNASGKRTYAAMLRKAPVRSDSKPDVTVDDEAYMPAYKLPTMVREKNSFDGVEWVLVEQDGREYAGDEGVPLGLILHRGTARVDAFPVSRTSTESTKSSSPSTVSSSAVLIPLKRLTTKRDSTQLPSNAIQKRGVATTSTAFITQIGSVGYAGHILIGTPPQRLAVLFDTGSDLALVTSDRCQGLECPELTHFSCSISTTCVDLGGGGSIGKAGSESDSAENTERKANHQVANKSVAGHGHSNPKSNSNNEPATVTPHLKLSSTTSSISSEPNEDQMRESVSKTLPSTSSTKENDMDSHIIHPTKRLVGPGGVIKIENNDRLLEDFHSNVNPASGNRIKSPSSPPPPPPLPSPWTNFYNQPYEDGSWGAGTFVQDRIQIDTTPAGEVYNPYSSLQVIDPDKFGVPPPPPPAEHSTTITFLDVVQDNLDLVRGYDGQISGLLGLTRASPTGHKTFLQELVEQGSLPQPVISMHLETE
ncbi:hypothetical protein BGX26_003330 [Mortierella sp. AD094]|nr:hypothetical protein BGX26_003330 [Mortierella sp. AD094]